jgi:hypothetical protein
MRRLLCAAVASAFATLGVVDAARPQSLPTWQRVYEDDQLVVDARSSADSSIKELRAEGVVSMPAHVVRGVLADVSRYPAFMPYVKKSEVLGNEAGDIIVYQRLSFPLLGLVKDREYVIRLTERIYVDARQQPVYRRAWHLEPSWPYPGNDSAVRVTTNAGYWDLRVADTGPHTIAVYCLFTDPGGSLPAWIINQANTTAVQKVFAAVRATSNDARYASVPPPAIPVPGAPPPGRADGCASR